MWRRIINEDIALTLAPPHVLHRATHIPTKKLELVFGVEEHAIFIVQSRK